MITDFFADLLIGYFTNIDSDEVNENISDWLERTFESEIEKFLSSIQTKFEIVFERNDDDFKYKVVKLWRGGITIYLKFEMYEGSYTYQYKYDNTPIRCEPKTKTITYFDD